MNPKHLLIAAVFIISLSLTSCQTQPPQAIHVPVNSSQESPDRWAPSIDSRQQPGQETNSSELVESLNERLVKESNLEALESQPSVAVALPPPPAPQPRRSESSKPVDGRTSGRTSLPPSSFTGGSGNSYMSMARDGSSRYEFGFDTSRRNESTRQPEVGGSRAAPRLMREEMRLEDGTVIGRYGYTDPFNVFRIVQYVAGEDGYFATEDVGALMEPTGANRFQLNKHLHQALEQARAQRKRATTSRATRTAAGPQQQQPVAQPNWKAASLPESNRVTRSNERSADETLSSSASQQTSVRYATRINHVVGANGLSYATAFRPVQTTRTSQAASASGIVNTYEPVRSPSAYQALQQRAQQFLSHEGLRSKLPAPIYTPSSFSHSSFIEHRSPLGSESQRRVYAADPQAEEAEDESGSAFHQTHQAPSWTLAASKSVWPPASVLQASPAWNVLNNNYNTPQSVRLIDHGATAHEPSLVAQRLGQQVAANFRHEAELLRRVQQNQKRPSPFGMVYNYAEQQPRVQETKLAPVAPVVPPPPPPSRTSSEHWSQRLTDQPMSELAGFGLALKQFDPPLYLPEVHETRPIEAQTAPSYSSTIVRSEVVAEQGYKPERVLAHNYRRLASEAGETLQRSSSEGAPSRPSEAQAGKSSDGSGRTSMILDNSTLDLGRATSAEKSPSENQVRPSETQPAAVQEATASRLANVPQIAPLLRYATRLSSAQLIRSEPDLDMENSEQVATYLNASNTTQAGSRAKLPDRSKKLSSIFKARTSAIAAEESSGRAAAKIRRPVPVNMKRPSQENELHSGAGASVAAGVEPSLVSAETQPSVGESPSLEDARKHQQVAASSKPPTGQVYTGKRFGKGANLTDKNRTSSVDHESANGSVEQGQSIAPVSAKKRPILREPKRVEPAEIELVLQTTTTTTARPPTVLTSTAETVRVPLASRTEQTDIVRVSEDLPAAMIIDATRPTGAEMKSLVDKALYEKIVKIQEEIAAMTMRAREKPTSTSTTALPEPETRPPTTSTSTTTERPSSTTPPPSTTSRAPAATTKSSASSPPPTTVGSLSITSTTSSPTTEPSLSRQETFDASQNRLDSPQATTVIVADQRQENPSAYEQASDQKLLTGPLLAMDGSMDQGDFLTKLVQDMDTAFDSVRASMPDQESVASTTTSTSATPTARLVAESRSPPIVDYVTISSTTTSAPTTTTTTTSTTATLRLVASTSPPASEGRESAKKSVEVAASAPLPVTDGPLRANGTRQQEQQAGLVSTEQSGSSQARTSSQAPAAVSTTGQPQVLEQQTTSQATTSTTTRATTIDSSSTSKRPTSAPRFGRLVIKRGHKVVARFNSSEPIPDSMIPVGGDGSEMIVPDMPRLAMRRSVKKRIGSANESPVVIVDKLKSKLASGASLELSEQLNATTSSPPQTTTNATSSAPRVSNSVANSSRQDPMLAEPSERRFVSLRSRGLLRGPRSYGSGGARFEPVADDPMVLAESSEVAQREAPTAKPAGSAGELPSDADQLRRLRSTRTGAKKFRSTKREETVRAPANASEQVSEPTGRVAGQRVVGGRNWSARLRDSVSREMAQPSNKKYDPKEDLKKLVEKITTIERQGELKLKGPISESKLKQAKKALPARSKIEPVEDTTGVEMFPLERVNASQASGNSSSREVRREEAKEKPTVIAVKPESSGPDATTPTQQDQQATASNITSSGRNETNQVMTSLNRTPGVLISPVRFDLNESIPEGAVGQPLNSTETRSNRSAQAAAAHLQVKSGLINVISNGSDHRAAMLGETKPLALNASMVGKLNLTLGAKKSQSSSVSFTVTMSPNLERHWQQLKPLNGSQHMTSLHKGLLVAATNQNSTGSNSTKPSGGNEIRVDSRGHIHVRNNQSLTVHVDIAPPARANPQPVNGSSLAEPAGKSEAGGDTGNLPTGLSSAKRLFSRDTSSADRHSQAADRRMASEVAKAETRARQQVEPVKPWSSDDLQESRRRIV